jgi:transposase
MCGVKTNVVSAVEITDPYVNDSPRLPGLLNATKKRFTVKEVSADKQYSSVNNLEVVDGVGAIPFIPFKQGTTGASGGVWERMFSYYQYRRQEFLKHYHLRSNAESTFMMVKTKFGDAVRSKTDMAMKNEVLTKFLCHNICCVIQSMYELGVEPIFWQEKAHRA